jgi:hypothetical protein
MPNFKLQKDTGSLLLPNFEPPKKEKRLPGAFAGQSKNIAVVFSLFVNYFLIRVMGI